MLAYASFARLIHEAYPRLYDRVFLDNHPLSRLLGGTSTLNAERLHRLLIDSLEWLRPLGSTTPASAEWRRYRHLQLRYVEGLTAEQIARDLQISRRQARRDHAEALDEIAHLLWVRLVRSGSPRAIEPTLDKTPFVSPGEPRLAATPSKGSLDAEISSFASTVSAASVDLGEVIQSVIETVSRLAESHQVRVVVDTTNVVDSLVVNRTIVRQILLNLLSDAIVRHPGGSIAIHTGHRDGFLDITISIPPAIGAFCSRSMTVSQGPTKSNLLAATPEFNVSRRLAESLNALLETHQITGAESVCLSLPLTSPKTILLVDDNPDVALLFRRYLADTEYRLVQARSSERALRLARELQPDIVILDVLMPSHDGWEILQTLRSESTTANLLVIICSVIPDHALAASLGVADFLAKPVTRPALLDLLTRVQVRTKAVDRQDQL